LWLAGYVVLQLLRAWVLLSLGRRWTTRIITVPGETLVRRGPYRFVSHPTIRRSRRDRGAAPGVRLWAYALVFSLLNAAVLSVRIARESAALRGA
jgi:methyltransferase